MVVGRCFDKKQKKIVHGEQNATLIFKVKEQGLSANMLKLLYIISRNICQRVLNKM